MSIVSELRKHLIWSLLALPLVPLTGLAADIRSCRWDLRRQNFSLPGVDGKIHKLSDYVSSKILVVVFTCDHCPNAQMYEGRVTQLYNEYKDKGVAVVAISPNDPKAIRIDELDSSDVSDTLDEMKIRVEYKHLQYPYLYDETPKLFPERTGRRLPRTSSSSISSVSCGTRAPSMTATGSSSSRGTMHWMRSTRCFADQEVAVKHTGAFGCTTKWSDKEAANVAFMEKLNGQPVSVDTVSEDGLKALHKNADGNVRLIQFWSTRCSECLKEFAGIQDIYRMYSDRNFELVVVSMTSRMKACCDAVVGEDTCY